MNRRTDIPANPTRARCAPRTRRGSALLIVIGILALVAVLGAVYISIGQSDTQSARAVVKRDQVQNLNFEAGSYIASVIAEDRFSTYPIAVSQGTDANRQRFARETWDYPYTDWSVRSTLIGGVDDYELFSPPGTHPLLYANTGFSPSLDPRVAYDPWLSSTEPEYLGPEVPVGTAPSINGRVFSGNRPEGRWLESRDWRQISNLAPDGRFVNLFNLRPQRNPFDNTIIGGFDALAGVGTYNDPETSDRRAAMTYGLSLLRIDNPNGVASTIEAFDPVATGLVWVPGADGPQPAPVSGDEMLNTPAVWTMNQRYMFFPMNQPFIMRDRGGQIADWESPDYGPYQYGDADGDGMADSRWFELTDASDPNNIIELDGDPEYRVFVAARVMDLSALVNLNVAGDLLSPPTVDYPYGLSLSEVDLRRLLTMSDQAFDWAPKNKATNAQYVRGSWQVPGQEEGLGLSNIDHPNDDVSGLGGDPIQVYRPYVLGLKDANDFPLSGHYNRFPDYSADLLTEAAKSYAAEVIGAYAYDALRLAIERETALDPRFTGLLDPSVLGTFPNADPDPAFELIQASNFWYDYDPVNNPARIDSPGSTYLTDPSERAQRRLDYDRAIGRIDPSRPGERVASPTDFGGGLFGIGDLAELLTYRGINDPSVTSRLEQTMLGRASDGSLVSRATSRRLSPLLSNRGLEFDRFGHGDGRVRGGGTPFPFVQGQIDPESMALFAVSPRLRLTTFSGVAQLKPDLSANPGLDEVTSSDAADKLEDVIGSAGALFASFRNALAPFPAFGGDAISSTWYDDVIDARDSRRPTSTTNYGHISAELAITLAAHMAVNTQDMADGDNRPTPATLLMDEDLRDELEDLPNRLADQTLFPWWRGDEGGAALDPGDGNIPDAGTLTDERRRARNIFGVEPQPMLVEATSIVVFTDAPEGAGGLADHTPVPHPALLNRDNIGIPGGNINPATVANITIDTSTRLWGGDGLGTSGGGNPDLALQLIAFKLTNPFDRDVTLNVTWDPDNQRWEPDYYLEYAGRFYALGAYSDFNDDMGVLMDGTTPKAGDGDGILELSDTAAPEQRYLPVTLEPGQSRVFYVLANNLVGHNDAVTASTHDFHELDNHWSTIMSSYGEHPGLDFDVPDDPDGTDGDPVTGPAWEWINRQLRIGTTNPARIKEFDPETGELRDATDTQTTGKNWRDIFTPVPQGDAVPVTAGNDTRRTKTNVVRLWRTMRAVSMGETDDINEQSPNIGQYNLVGNDLLADRLAGALGGNALDPIAPLAGASDAIDNTISFPEDAEVDPNPCSIDKAYRGSTNTYKRNDNTGWTFALWGTIRRPDNEDRTTFGQIPQWMLEVRDTTAYDTDTPAGILGNISRTWAGSSSTVLMDLGMGDVDASEVADIICGSGFKDYRTGINIKSDLELAVSLRELWDLREDSVAMTIGEPPGTDDGTGNNADPDGALPTDWRQDTVAQQKFATDRTLGMNAAMETLGEYNTADALQPELYINNESFERPDAMGANSHSVARPGDLLLALGVGPVQAPNPDALGNPGLDYDVDEEWITLAEMLAIALGYDVPKPHPAGGPPTDAAFRVDDPYFGIVNQWTDLDRDGNVYPTDDPDDWRYVLPNGRLAINDFVSFFDVDTDGLFTEPGGLNAGNINDVRTGSGIPMALDVMSRVRLHEPLEPLGGTTSSDYLVQRVVPGMININTAPASTLRLLAGLSPSYESFVLPTPSGSTTERAWWAAQHGAGDPSVFNLTDYERSPDIAGSIVAYRDRLVPAWRRASDPALNGFTPNTDPAMATELRFDPFVPAESDLPIVAERNYHNDIGRALTTGIPGLRETPGFRSTAELLAVTLRETNDPVLSNGASNPNFDAYRHLTMQALGQDGLRADLVGVSGARASIESDTYDDGNAADDIIDDLGERLAIANNVLGAVSVSSDVYAVWFLVHGYTEGDVSELRPGDPLVPSYARRFLMILDRSNVTSEDDAPRVVHFREIPM